MKHLAIEVIQRSASPNGARGLMPDFFSPLFPSLLSLARPKTSKEESLGEYWVW